MNDKKVLKIAGAVIFSIICLMMIPILTSSSKINSLKSENNKLTKVVNDLNNKNVDLNTILEANALAYTEKRIELETRIANLIANHASEILNINSSHAKELKELQDELQKLKQEHEVSADTLINRLLAGEIVEKEKQSLIQNGFYATMDHESVIYIRVLDNRVYMCERSLAKDHVDFNRYFYGTFKQIDNVTIYKLVLI